jgi:hypothetical protein
LFEKAAKGISDIDVTSAVPMYHTTVFPASCDSLAGQYWWFYYGVTELFAGKIETPGPDCPVTLFSLLQAYFSASASDPNYSPNYYKMEYNHYAPNWENSKSKNKLHGIFSAYMPGPYNGISADGTFEAPPGFPSQKEVMRRNFYSTKLVTLDSLQKGGGFEENLSNFAIYSEGELNKATPDRKQGTFANPLDAQSVGADISSIRY